VERLLSFPYSRASAVDNMAWDSAMLATGHAHGQPFWRVYGWSEPAVTFGYSQKWETVQREIQPFTGAAVRRLTGGGIVDHRKDLTYALSLPSAHSFHRLPALELYRQFHGCIVDVLREAGLNAALAPCPGPCGTRETGAAGVCFQRAEPYDVVNPSSGDKIAGAAMKRNADGILIQGSLEAGYLDPLSGEDFNTALSIRLAQWMGLRSPAPVPSDVIPKALLAGAVGRFGSLKWNRRR
jgi:lipoate-protein ligase A